MIKITELEQALADEQQHVKILRTINRKKFLCFLFRKMN
jgi:hypothetical protein